MGVRWQRQTAWLWGSESLEGSLALRAWLVPLERGTARLRMASLRLGLAAGRAWLSDLMSELESGLESGRVRREGFVWLWSAQWR
jgi:hypothetical protein